MDTKSVGTTIQWEYQLQLNGYRTTYSLLYLNFRLASGRANLCEGEKEKGIKCSAPQTNEAQQLNKCCYDLILTKNANCTVIQVTQLNWTPPPM